MRRAAFLVLALAAASCALFADWDGLSGEGATADAGVDHQSTETGAPGEAAPPDAGPDATCKGTKGPKGVRVGTYCVDATEVTGRDYEEFLAAKAGDTSGQPPECAWNTSFETTFQLRPEYPVRGIDWCDAWAYCAWAGKRLCGHVDGGPVEPSLRANTFADAWFRACSADGTRTFPYGDAFDANACNLPDMNQPGAVPVASLPGCEGGYPGVFDMTGNLWEWEDSCESAEPFARCAMRGGSYAANTQGECSFVLSEARNGGSDVTIRCCSD